MKKVVDGKIYDTEKAEEIATDEFSSPGDFRFWSEGLYKTEKGCFFEAGEGGALSRYSKYVGNGTYVSGEKIRPLTEDEAYNWLIQTEGVNPSVIEAYFPGRLETA